MDEAYGPVVSVLCTAYNHEAFIGKTIESFLSQKVDFKYEVIVHDDASTDSTASIIRTFEKRYPSIVKGIYQLENQHSRAKGKVARILYSSASGKYIALCEGDDHWIDPNKLQRQIEALEADREAIACFTDAFNERNGIREPFMGPYAKAPEGTTIGQLDLIKGQGIPTCTFVFRNIDLTRFHDLRRIAPVGDTLLFIHLADQGHFIYQPERTGVRIMHQGGIHSLTSAVHKLKVHLETLPFMDQLSDHKYSDVIAARRRKALDLAWHEAVHTNNRELARYVFPLIKRERSAFGWNATTTLRNFLKAYWPLPERIYSRLSGASA